MPAEWHDPPPRAPVDKMNNAAFFYGTLMAPGVLYRVIYGTANPELVNYPALKYLRPRSAMLHGYKRRKVIGADYPAITPEKGGCVRGTVVEGLTEGDLWRLDIFEGTQYERKKVRVKVLNIALDEAAPDTAESERQPRSQTNNHIPAQKPEKVDEEVEAHTYVWFSAPSELDPGEWDFEEFKREKMQAWMGMGFDEDESNGVKKDEGFEDVDRAVAEMARQEKKDGMGGRGVNGHIGKQLAEAQRNGNGEPPELLNVTQ